MVVLFVMERTPTGQGSSRDSSETAWVIPGRSETSGPRGHWGSSALIFIAVQWLPPRAGRPIPPQAQKAAGWPAGGAII